MRLRPEQRRSLIVSTGVRLANQYGLTQATPARISEACTKKTSQTTVRAYFNQGELWTAIVGHREASDAIKKEAADLGLI